MQADTTETRPKKSGPSVAAWAMLANIIVSGILFSIGLYMCNTAPSIENDPVCRVQNCMMGDPQGIQGVVLMLKAVGLFVIASGLIGVLALMARQQQKP